MPRKESETSGAEPRRDGVGRQMRRPSCSTVGKLGQDKWPAVAQRLARGRQRPPPSCTGGYRRSALSAGASRRSGRASRPRSGPRRPAHGDARATTGARRSAAKRAAAPRGAARRRPRRRPVRVTVRFSDGWQQHRWDAGFVHGNTVSSTTARATSSFPDPGRVTREAAAAPAPRPWPTRGGERRPTAKKPQSSRAPRLPRARRRRPPCPKSRPRRSRARSDEDKGRPRRRRVHRGNAPIARREAAIERAPRHRGGDDGARVLRQRRGWTSVMTWRATFGREAVPTEDAAPPPKPRRKQSRRRGEVARRAKPAALSKSRPRRARRRRRLQRRRRRRPPLRGRPRPAARPAASMAGMALHRQAEIMVQGTRCPWRLRRRDAAGILRCASKWRAAARSKYRSNFLGEAPPRQRAGRAAAAARGAAAAGAAAAPPIRTADRAAAAAGSRPPRASRTY